MGLRSTGSQGIMSLSNAEKDRSVRGVRWEGEVGVLPGAHNSGFPSSLPLVEKHRPREARNQGQVGQAWRALQSGRALRMLRWPLNSWFSFIISYAGFMGFILSFISLGKQIYLSYFTV